METDVTRIWTEIFNTIKWFYAKKPRKLNLLI